MEIHDGNRKVTSSKYSPNIFKFCFKFKIDKNRKLKTITRPIPTNHTWPHVFSCPITLIAGKSHISIKYSRGHGAKSIKTFFLKGKAHESWNCREDQIEKKMQLHHSKSNRNTHRRPNNPEWTGMHKKS